MFFFFFLYIYEETSQEVGRLVNKAKTKYMMVGTGTELENGHQSLECGELHLEKVFRYQGTVIN